MMTMVSALLCSCVVASVMASRVMMEDYDVVVSTATPGGLTSAIGAAKEGARVVLLEPGLYLGGMMSGGLGLTDYGFDARVIGGISKEFFERTAIHYNVSFEYPQPKQCSTHQPPWVFEPHVAENIFHDMLVESNVTVEYQARIVHAERTERQSRPVIQSVTTADGRVFTARVFIDGSYEGSLMKLANVSYTFGREANTTYNESCGGRLPPGATGVPFGHTSQLPKGINPYTDGTNKTSIPLVGVDESQAAPVGAADLNVGAYDWRLTVTDDPSNMVPIPEPENYDPAEFELIRRVLKAESELGNLEKSPCPFPVPNRKSDWKMFGTWGEYSGAQNKYPNASWEQQQEIVADFKRYALSLIHFYKTDPLSPIRESLATVGLCKDEYNRSDHWMPQLYVRSALRMVGRRILTQTDVYSETYRGLADGIGLGAYTIDIPGAVQRLIVDGEVVNEGSMQCPSFCVDYVAPFALPYSIMLPKEDEIANILVPVAASASHVGFNAIRLEPTWMILGQAAGVAAGAVAKNGEPVDSIDVAKLQARLRDLGAVLSPPS